jgi:hypothetical protein
MTRARDHFGSLRTIRVLVDGQTIGEVPYGQRAEFALEPGVYLVQVAMDWCRSEAHEVHVRQGEVVELEGGLRWRGLGLRWSLLGCFIFPWRVFVVTPCEGQPAKSPWSELWEGACALIGYALISCLVLRLLSALFG